MKDESLSDKIWINPYAGVDSLDIKDVKEFIKIVLIDCSEAFESNELEIVEFIMKKRAGEELI